MTSKSPRRARRVNVALSLLLVASAAVPSASGQTTTGWPMFQHDPGHSGRASVAGPAQGGTLWSFILAHQPGSPAVATDGTIYVPSGIVDDAEGFLYALNPDGTQKWRAALPGPPGSGAAPAIGPDGTIYVHANGSGGNIAAIETLSAFDPNGNPKWSYEFNEGAAIFTSDNQSSPVIAPNGSIWVGSGDTRLFSFDPDGNVNCSVSPSVSTITASPAIAPDGTVYALDASMLLVAYDQSCDVKWSEQLGEVMGAVDQSPAIGADGTVYVPGLDEVLYALTPSGALRCSYDIGQDVSAAPAIAADGTVYLAADRLIALTPDCVEKWKFPAESALFSSMAPIVDADGTIYWRESWKLYAVNPDGTKKWSVGMNPGYGSGSDPGGALTVAGVLYIGDGGFTGEPRLRALTDNVAPDVRIVRGPSGRTTDRTPTFRFRADEAVVVFECRMDAQGWSSCSSPKTYGRLSLGSHRFRVRASDTAGNFDATPATRSFRIVRG